jgi:DNA-binding transcriptional LysR family regulator
VARTDPERLQFRNQPVRYSERMDWNDLRYLLAFERRGSLSGVATELSVTKATASRRLSALEEALGAPLFERTPRGLVLTDAGREALTLAHEMADRVSAFEDRKNAQSEGEARGVVRITAPPWLAERVLIPGLAKLRERYPALEVDLAGTNQIMNLSEREADLALRNVRPTQPSLVSRKVCVLGGSVYASKLYLERRGVPQSRDQVRGHDVLVYETLGGMPGFEWLRAPETGGNVAFRARDPVALVGAATAGLGLAAVPCMLGDPEPALSRVETLGFSRCDMFLVMPEAVGNAQRVRVASEFVCEQLREHRTLVEG